MPRRPRPIGYYKDLLAVVAFAAALGLVAADKLPKPLLLAGIAWCLATDAAFTLRPEWHCIAPDPAHPATWIVGLQAVGVGVVGALAFF